jgi:DNA-binding response OmpR family regulator
MAKHILLIDDEAEVRDLVGEALTVEGFRVTGVCSTNEAMQIIRDDLPQLIITDLQLGELDGFDLIEQVKAIVPQMPIILLTGMLFDKDVVRGAVWQKIAAYVPKTSTLDHIIQTVKQQIGS